MHATYLKMGLKELLEAKFSSLVGSMNWVGRKFWRRTWS